MCARACMHVVPRCLLQELRALFLAGGYHTSPAGVPGRWPRQVSLESVCTTSALQRELFLRTFSEWDRVSAPKSQTNTTQPCAPDLGSASAALWIWERGVAQTFQLLDEEMKSQEAKAAAHGLPGTEGHRQPDAKPRHCSGPRPTGPTLVAAGRLISQDTERGQGTARCLGKSHCIRAQPSLLVCILSAAALVGQSMSNRTRQRGTRECWGPLQTCAGEAPGICWAERRRWPGWQQLSE